MTIVNVEVRDAICTGRNGTFDLAAVQIYVYGGENDACVSIEAVSKVRKQTLNAGFWGLTPIEMDELCQKWLKARGKL